MRLLETEHLTREFGGVIAVNDVDFHVEKFVLDKLHLEKEPLRR